MKKLESLIKKHEVEFFDIIDGYFPGDIYCYMVAISETQPNMGIKIDSGYAEGILEFLKKDPSFDPDKRDEYLIGKKIFLMDDDLLEWYMTDGHEAINIGFAFRSDHFRSKGSR